MTGSVRNDPTDSGRLAALAVAKLQRMVSHESPSGDPVRLGGMTDLVARAFQDVGGTVERVASPSGDHLVISWAPDAGAADPHILIVGHLDTALPAGTIDEHPFRLDGDVLTGPGVYDMKGGLVALELALGMIADQRRRLRAPVRLVVVNDEEIGSPDGRRVIERHATGAAAALGLEPALAGGGLKIGRRGVARVRLIVRGREAHAGLAASEGVSAIDELVDQLQRLRFALPATDALSVNIGLIEAGRQANVVAGLATAELGLRFADAEAEELVFRVLGELTPLRDGAAIEVERLTHRPAWAPAADNPVAAELVARAAALGFEISTGVSGGAGDTNQLGSSGVPTVDGLGPDGGGAHSPGEHASLRSVLERAALLADYLAPRPREGRHD